MTITGLEYVKMIFGIVLPVILFAVVVAVILYNVLPNCDLIMLASIVGIVGVAGWPLIKYIKWFQDKFMEEA